MGYSARRLRRSITIEVININGNILKPEDAKISVFDRGFLFGDSVYEVTDAINGSPIFMDEHLTRLWQSANKIDMPINFTRSKIIAEVQKTLKVLNTKRAYIRIVVTRGEGEITLDPQAAHNNNLVIITKELPENPKWWYQDGVEVIIAGIKRTSIESMDPAVKSGNYLNNILAFNEAIKSGAFDAVMLNHDGDITEGTTSNIWMIKDKKLFTPPLKAGLLGGITRAKVLELCHKEGFKVEEKNISPEEFKSADEAFLTSSTKRIVPIVKVDQTTLGTGKPGKVTLAISQIYNKLI
jgi:branched-chain amino acid aminotransferase